VSFLIVIASEAKQSQEKQNSKIKGQREEGKSKSKVKDQNEEGFYILICHFDFLCLIFNIVRNLMLGIQGFNLEIASARCASQ